MIVVMAVLSVLKTPNVVIRCSMKPNEFNSS
jgi:hypothetical protein